MAEGNKGAEPAPRLDDEEVATSATAAGTVEIELDAADTAPSDAPHRSRTATLDDPLTTSLLAEVARRLAPRAGSPPSIASPRSSTTRDVAPEQIEEALDVDPGDAEAAAASSDDPARRTPR